MRSSIYLRLYKETSRDKVKLPQGAYVTAKRIFSLVCFFRRFQYIYIFLLSYIRATYFFTPVDTIFHSLCKSIEKKYVGKCTQFKRYFDFNSVKMYCMKDQENINRRAFLVSHTPSFTKFKLRYLSK